MAKSSRVFRAASAPRRISCLILSEGVGHGVSTELLRQRGETNVTTVQI